MCKWAFKHIAQGPARRLYEGAHDLQWVEFYGLLHSVYPAGSSTHTPLNVGAMHGSTFQYDACPSKV